MSDFAQHGRISTLQLLRADAGETFAGKLGALSEKTPLTLILPCHAADATGPALPRILGELRAAPFVRTVVISINGANEACFRAVKALASKELVVWNDGRRLREAYASLMSSGVVPSGKGFNVWAAIGAAAVRDDIVALHDSDVLSFRRETLARLSYPAAESRMAYAFCKSYYSRATDRLHGRVSRLFLAPLLQALLRIAGHHPLLDFLLSFRYPLAGECSMRGELALAVPFGTGWDLEISMLCEVFRRVDLQSVCQVDGGENYEHKHQPVDHQSGGLVAMVRPIANALFAELRTEGLDLGSAFVKAVCTAYAREANDALRRSEHLALMNALPYDRAQEEQTVAQFARILHEPGTAPPKLPPWDDLAGHSPDFVEAFRDAVAADNA